MIKKISILFTFILILSFQFIFIQDLNFSTVVYAEETKNNASNTAEESVTTESATTEKYIAKENANIVNPEKKAATLSAFMKNYYTNTSVFQKSKPNNIFSKQDLETIKKYQNQVIPINYYFNDDNFYKDYNAYQPIVLAIDLLEQQTGLDFELVPIKVDPNKPIEEQLKSRKTEEVCIDVIKSNNLSLFANRYDELSVSKPVFSDAFFIVAKQSNEGFDVQPGAVVGYDSSTYSVQTDAINKSLVIKSMSPQDANKQIKNNVVDYYFTTSTMNLPTVMENSKYMYTPNQNQPALRNMISSMNGFGVNKVHDDLMSVINNALTEHLVAQVKEYNYSYISVVKEATFFASLTEDELAFIKYTPKISIALNNSKNILHEEKGQYVGLIPDVMAQVSALTNIEPVYTEPDTLSFITDSFESKAKDINIIAIYTTQVAEKLKTDFNASANKVTYGAVFNSFKHQMEIIKHFESPDITSFDQLKFSQLGTTTSFLENTMGFLTKNNITTDYLTVFDTKQELLEAIQNGSIDYAFVTPGTTNYYADLTDYGIATAHISQSVVNTPTEDWTILVHSNTNVEALNSILSKSISSMDGDGLFEKWFTSKPEYEVYSGLNQTNKFLLYFSTILIVFALTILTQFNNTRQKNFNSVNKAVNFDNLTKLKNSNYFKDDRDTIYDGIFIVGQFTRFKYATQLYGTAKANQILVKKVDILKKLCGEESIYRITDDKFYIVLEENEEEITNITKKIFNEITRGVEIEGYTYHLGWVMAVSPISTFQNNIREAISVTNMSCENLAYNGKFRYIIVDEKEHLAIKENQKIKNSLKIINSTNVYPYYQPFLDAETLKVKGCEVLARLIIKGEIIPAYKFINEAEKLGTLGDIDEMLLEKTIALRSDLLVKGIIDSNFYFSVNLSAQYLKKMTSDDLYTLARRFNLKSFDFLQIEILEEELSKEEITKIKRIIREFNLRTAIDDFSTGHSTIARLNNFNFDVVKMDRSLLPINFTELDKQIYLSLISMVSGFSNEIVVEGVETEEHVEFLQKTSVSTLQGFYFAKPMASNDFVEYILTINEL